LDDRAIASVEKRQVEAAALKLRGEVEEFLGTVAA
jgi:hypothetical protein